MTVYTRFFVSGIEYSDVNNLIVNKSVSQNTAVSNFNATLDSPYGRHKSDFNINNEVIVYADTNVILPTSSPGLQFTFASSGASIVDTVSGIIGSPIATGGGWVQGKIGSAISISGGQHFRVSPTLEGDYNVNEGSPFSLTSWVYLSGGSVVAGFAQGIFIKGSTSAARWALDFTGSGHNLRFGTRSGGFTMAVTSPAGPNTWRAGEWTHIAGTYNGSNLLQMYLNGNIAGSFFTNGSGFNVLTGSIAIGRGQVLGGNTGSELIYYIDDCRFYNNQLTPYEVSSLYNKGVGNETKNNINQKLFTGTVELIDFQGQELDETVTMQGNDYSSRLLDNTVPPVVYTNTEVGSIVRNLITENTTEIGSQFINTTSTVLKRISFNEIPIYEAVQQLADLSGYMFYMDNDKQLHFELAGSNATGNTFGSGNIIRTVFDKTKEGMANVVKVYGDRYLLAAPRESYVVASQGSVFTLGYRPHSTNVSTSLTGGSLLKGGIFEVNSTVYSGIDYLVNFDDKQIILVSGNNTLITYNNIPPDGGSVVINYDRSLPIIKAAEDLVSISAFGAKTKIINDKSIKDPNTAKAILNAEIQKSNPLNNLQLLVNGWYGLEPGRTVNISLPNFNIVESGVPIVQINYNLSPQTIHDEEVITLTLDKRPVDLTDKFRDITKRLEAIEAQDRLETDTISRLQYATGSFIFVGSRYFASMKWNGSEFRTWPSSDVPPLGSNFTPRLGLLVSGDIAHSSWVGSVSYLASGTFGFGPFLQVSGGFYA